MTWGEIFTALGYATGAAVLVWQARRRRMATEGMAWLAAAAFLGGVIGAKLTQLVFEGWPLRVPWYVVAEPQTGGRALLGGVIFGWLALEIVKRKLGIRRSTGDLFALALPAGEAVGRIGCFFNACCYGTACDLPWAVEQHGALRHPAQLYSAITAAMIFVALLEVRRRASLQEGDLFRLYLVLFGCTRFALEFVRQNDAFWFGLTPMQWFSAELVIFGALFWVRSRKMRPVAHE